MAAKYIVTADEAGTWSVIDGESEMPAVLDGVPQVGLAEDEANGVADVLNGMIDDEE